MILGTICIIVGLVLLGQGYSEAQKNNLPEIEQKYQISGLVLVCLGLLLFLYSFARFMAMTMVVIGVIILMQGSFEKYLENNQIVPIQINTDIDNIPVEITEISNTMTNIPSVSTVQNMLTDIKEEYKIAGSVLLGFGSLMLMLI